MANNSQDLEKKIEQLLTSVQILAEVVEKRGRVDMPSSMMRYSSYSGNSENEFLRNRSQINSTDFANLMNDVYQKLNKEFEDTEVEIEAYNKALENTTLTQEERVKIEEKLNKKIEEQDEIEKKLNKGSEEYFKELQKIREEKLREEFKAFSKEKKELYGNDENNYVNFKIGEADFKGKSANRVNASRMIAESGLGNTAVGRYGQTIIGRQQKIDEIAHFGDVLQTGGAEQLSQALGGGKLMTSALKGLGTGLSSVSKLLGPFSMGIQIGIDAIKLFAQVLGAANAYITHLVNMQTDLNEMSFQKNVDISNLINERQVEATKFMGDIALKQLDIQGQNLLQAVDIATKQFVKATEIAVGPLTKGINESAYDAANTYIDIQKDIQKFGIEREQRASEFGRFQKRRDIEYENFQKISGREQERIEGKYKFDSILKSVDGILTAQNNLVGRAANFFIGENEDEKRAMRNIELPNGNYSDNAQTVVKKNNKTIGKLLGDSYQNAFLDYFGAGFKDKNVAVLKNGLQPELFGVEWNKQIAQWQSNLSNTISGIQEQIGNKEIEISTQAAEKYIEATAEVKKMWLQLAQKTEQWLDKFDEVTNNLGISLGYTNRKQLDNFQDSMFKASLVAAKFGKSFEDVVKIQQSFTETTGRNRMFGEHDYGQMLGLGKYLGDDGLAANYASEMEIFNAGVADSVDMLDKVLQDVNKIGLNGRKYTKTLVDNLKLAQKYQFKDGTKGLMRMAKWAENTRFNMSSLSGMLDKISEGGLEGVITQGAQFQVLGGHAAMNADPIAMMYERYADPEAFAKRMQDMTIGYGAVDKVTGETKFTGNEVMMLEQIAKVQGRSTEDVMNEVRARNKREVVAKQLGGKFDEDQQAFISNNATYNKETGQFQVKVKRGNEYVDTDINELTEDDLKHLIPETHNERMEDYMSTVIDYLAMMTGEENYQKTMMGESLNTTRKESYLTRLQTAHENFTEEFETYVTNAKEGMNLANEKFSDYINMWQNNVDAQGPGLDNINAATSNIVNALGETASVISDANQKIKDAVLKLGGDVNGQNNITSQSGEKYTPELKPNAASEQAIRDDIKRRKEIRNNKQIEIPNVGRTGTDWSSLPRYDDGIISNNNSPIISHANNVTKINDGLVQSDPRDVAIFAKEGGVIGNFLADLYNDIHSGNGNVSIPKDMNIHMDGKLELTSQNGQGIDIMTYLQNDPIMLRALSRLIAKHITEASNGGRGTLNIGIANV